MPSSSSPVPHKSHSTSQESPSGLSELCLPPDDPLDDPPPVASPTESVAPLAVLPTPLVVSPTVSVRPLVVLPRVSPTPPTLHYEGQHMRGWPRSGKMMRTVPALPAVSVTPPTVLPTVSVTPPRSPKLAGVQELVW